MIAGKDKEISDMQERVRVAEETMEFERQQNQNRID